MTEPEKVELAGFVTVVVKMFCGLPKDMVVNVWHTDYQDFVSVCFSRTFRGLRQTSEFRVNPEVMACKKPQTLLMHIQLLTQDALEKMETIYLFTELPKVPG